jgi:hypothetical protein
VTEPLADDLRMHSGLERERRMGMPEVVEADRGEPGGGGGLLFCDSLLILVNS